MWMRQISVQLGFKSDHALVILDLNLIKVSTVQGFLEIQLQFTKRGKIHFKHPTVY